MASNFLILRTGILQQIQNDAVRSNSQQFFNHGRRELPSKANHAVSSKVVLFDIPVRMRSKDSQNEKIANTQNEKGHGLTSTARFVLSQNKTGNEDHSELLQEIAADLDDIRDTRRRPCVIPNGFELSSLNRTFLFGIIKCGISKRGFEKHKRGRLAVEGLECVDTLQMQARNDPQIYCWVLRRFSTFLLDKEDPIRASKRAIRGN